MKAIFKNSSIVFQRKHQKQIVYKDYWVRTSGQYINLTDLGTAFTGLKFNQIKGILNAKFINVDATTERIVWFKGGNSQIIIPAGKQLSYYPDGSNGCIFDAFTADTVFEMSFDAPQKSATMGGVTKTITGTVSTSAVEFGGIYMASGPSASTYTGKTKFSRLRLYNATDDTPICDIRPALVDGVPCLYDAVTDQEFYSEDETALVLEDA